MICHLAIALIAAGLQAGARPTPEVDPRARTALAEMTRAYRSARTLEQVTVYDSGGTAAARVVRSRLVIQRPNRLLLELYERAPEKPEPAKRIFVSDGKQFYTWDEITNHYLQEKAPRDLSGFRELASSVEMLALCGTDPFAQLSEQVRAARMEEPEEVDGVLCDVVLLDVGGPERTGDLRFYIARADRLLRRVRFESNPVEKPAPEPVEGKKLLPDDPFAGVTESETPPPPPLPVYFRYESKVTANRDVPKETFRWSPPEGALRLLNNPRGYLSQNTRRQGTNSLGQALDPRNIAPVLDTSRPTRRVHAKDLAEQARKQKRR